MNTRMHNNQLPNEFRYKNQEDISHPNYVSLNINDNSINGKDNIPSIVESVNSTAKVVTLEHIYTNQQNC